MADADIPAGPPGKPRKKQKRPPQFKVGHNSIKPEDRIEGGVPPFIRKGPERKEFTEFSRVRQEVDTFYSASPEKRMVVWRKLWEASSPARAQRVKQEFRLSAMQDTAKYIIAVQGKWLWFTIRPPKDEETEEQAHAWAEYYQTRGRLGRGFTTTKRQKEDEDDDEDLDT